MPVMSKVESVCCRSAPWRAFTRRLVLPWALGDTELGGRVLEIGSGAASDAEEMLRRFPSVRITATDVDPAMVAAAQRGLRRFGSRATVVNADATRLPFANEAFDVVVSFLMLHHVIAWEEALTEAGRVLRPGGLLMGYDLLRSAPAQVLHRLDRSPHRLMSDAELRSRLISLELSDVGVVAGLGRLVARFKAGKMQATGPSRTSDEGDR
ncbi:MAG: class I SAM-dependent methyltransferase [Acidimicrobiia bacterium]